MFLNLSRIVINKNHILALSKGRGKYIIHLCSSMDAVLIAGNIKTECDGIEICEKKNSGDYKKITNWIENI